MIHFKIKHIDGSDILIKGIFIFLLTILSYNARLYSAVIGDRESRIKQIKAQFDSNNWEAGKKIMDYALEQYPEDPDLRVLSGKYYFHNKQYDKARHELNRSLKYKPNNFEAKQILVNVETESKRYSSAICYINELLEVAPFDRDLWRKKIELYDLQGNTDEAKRLRKRIGQIYANDSSLLNDFLYYTEKEANTKRREGKIDETISLTKELLHSQPNNAEYHLNLINDYLKAGDQNSALIHTERGLVMFPGDLSFIDKKTSLLAEQKRYDELLSFLQQQMKKGNSYTLRQQYDYYLQEAASNAKNSEPAVLYDKILKRNPNNEEAFSYVFNNAMANQQYEEALAILNKFRKIKGASKDLSMKELQIYHRMGNTARASSLTKQLFAKYPDDSDLMEAYTNIVSTEAKLKMNEGRYVEAVENWNIVLHYGDSEMKKVAQNGLYNAYIAMNDYNNALDILEQMEKSESGNPDLYIKRADIYLKQQHFQTALSAYERAISISDNNQKSRYIGGLGDMLTIIIKQLNEQYLYDEAMEYTEQWLEHDPYNSMALRYAVNLAHSRRNNKELFFYAQRGHAAYPDDVFFKIKLAEINKPDEDKYAETYASLHKDLQKHPYHKDLINAFTQLSEDYSKKLLKDKENEKSITIIDTALHYNPKNKSLLYMKGLAFEKIHRYDSAYYYQRYYEPSLTEVAEFKQHLNYLKNKNYRNELGFYFLNYLQRNNRISVNTVATVEYSRFENSNTYVGRINYTGRGSGKGFQLQTEWTKEWSRYIRTKIAAAWANDFFPKTAFDASVYFNISNGFEGELGAGYRRLREKQNLTNIVVGATKEIDSWRINLRFNNLILNKEEDNQWLYNLSANVRYYLSSPKNYITVVGSIGSSPDIDIINYQFYDGFSVINTMVGGGIGHMIASGASIGLLGSWYNYKVNNTNYRNLYNIYLNVNVTF